jgi:hypothetical protein
LAGGQPVFFQELFAHFLLFFGCFILGVVSPVYREELRAARSASNLCFLPQAWFMFLVGTFNLFIGKTGNPINYTSFVFSLFHVITSSVEIGAMVWHYGEEMVGSIFVYNKSRGSWVFDIRDFMSKWQQIPLYYHIDIYVAVATGIVLAATNRHGTIQGILLIIVYAARVGVHFLQLKWTTSRVLTKLKIACSASLFLFVLFALILHSKKQGREGVVVLSVFCMIFFLVAIALTLSTFVVRIVDFFRPQEIDIEEKKEEPAQPRLLQRASGSGQKKEQDLNQSARVGMGLLDRYIHNVDYSKMNESEQPSEAHIRLVDQSMNKNK